ncbi:DUF1778 domain-containing protein [Bradyrhizobium daqingense]|uniref:Uncharacterized protein (DUF1778 family) n=1 Tax=Bradyrhizobium daqingense TaxID=993502 RepID=A0A562LMK8_9BRAD|nr:DUF1778 domain-containing protein [Bradyrhizobium daqingense]TWI08837.1 uncharacterized protein (DUF1778 family) [Bradyrhizobium daqingense]UFS87254.1 DUF1778 domain-containing protein [Bradyrhizobium daqingense]
MIKTEKEAKTKAKPRPKIRRTKLGLAETQSMFFTESLKVRRRKAAPESGLLESLTNRLASLEDPAATTSRLEARIPTSIYKMMERAATLRGLSITAYVTATMGEDARRTIEQDAVVRLSRADQIAFAEALINPPVPSAKLVAAAKRHAPMTRK